MDCFTLPLIHTLYCRVLKQGCIKYHFKSMTRPGIEPRSPGPLANTIHLANEPVKAVFISRYSKLYHSYIFFTHTHFASWETYILNLDNSIIYRILDTLSAIFRLIISSALVSCTDPEKKKKRKENTFFFWEKWWQNKRWSLIYPQDQAISATPNIKTIFFGGGIKMFSSRR